MYSVRITLALQGGQSSTSFLSPSSSRAPVRKVKRDNFVPFIPTGPCCFRHLGLSAGSHHDTTNSHTCRSCFCFERQPQGHLQPRYSRGWSGAGRRAGGWHGGRSSSGSAVATHASPPSRGSGRVPLRPPGLFLPPPNSTRHRRCTPHGSINTGGLQGAVGPGRAPPQ